MSSTLRLASYPPKSVLSVRSNSSSKISKHTLLTPGSYRSLELSSRMNLIAPRYIPKREEGEGRIRMLSPGKLVEAEPRAGLM